MVYVCYKPLEEHHCCLCDMDSSKSRNPPNRMSGHSSNAVSEYDLCIEKRVMKMFERTWTLLWQTYVPRIMLLVPDVLQV